MDEKELEVLRLRDQIPLKPGEGGVDTGSPLMWRAMATSLLIHTGYNALNTPVADNRDHVQIAIEDFDVNATNGQEVVIWADAEIAKWLTDTGIEPPEQEWGTKAAGIAKQMAPATERKAAAVFAEMPKDMLGRNVLARNRAVAAAIGAAARAAALAMLLPDPNNRLIEMSSRLFPLDETVPPKTGM